MIDPIDQFELSAPNCVADEFDGEVVVLHMPTGVYHCIRGLGAALWGDMIDGHSLPVLLTAISTADPELAEAARTFARDLVAMDLLRPVCRKAPEGIPSVVAACASGERHLLIDSYDDMRDLVLSDPIHDADDERGWPVLKA